MPKALPSRYRKRREAMQQPARARSVTAGLKRIPAPGMSVTKGWNDESSVICSV